MKRIIIIFGVLTSLNAFAQVDSNSISTEFPDSIKTLIPLTLTNIDNYPELYLNFTEFSFYDSHYLHFESDESYEQSQNLFLIKEQMLSQFSKKLEWDEQKSLGVFGKYLGIAGTATAIGLAIKHVVKYKGRAFFQRK